MVPNGSRIAVKEIIIVSDNHGSRQVMEDLLNIYDSADVFIHLGDSEFSPNDKLWKKYHTVCGNNDFYEEYPEDKTLKVGHNIFYLTHGHKKNVKHSLNDLQESGKQNEADFVLFGHSHIAVVEEVDGIIFINPGSLSRPRGKYKDPSYVQLKIKKDKVEVTIKNQNHQRLSQYNFNKRNKRKIDNQ